MQKFLTEFETYCRIPGVDSNKANAYAKAIKYLCDYLKISVIDTHSVSKIKSVEKDIYDKSSPFYYELLTSLERQKRKSYLESGFIRAALKLFFDFAPKYCSTTEQSISDKIKAVIQAYKADFATRDKEERYKWKAVGTYKKHWGRGSSDFLQMLKSAFSDTDNLLRSGNYYPYKMLEVFAEAHPETVQALFKMLYDETLTFEERYSKFREGFTAHFKPQNLLHYQDLHAISVYLSFEYPEKYYIYKYTVVKNFIKQIGFPCGNIDAMTDAEKMDLTLDLYNTVLEVVLQDEELKQMSRDRLDDTCHSDDAYHMLTHDVIYFGSQLKDEYWPSLEEYDPHLTKEDWTQYILNVEKPNHPRPMQMLKALMELGGEATCKQLSEVYGGTVSGYVGCTVNLGKRAKKHFHLEPCMDGDNERFFPIPFLGRGVKNEQNEENYSYRIRPELFDALSEIDLSDITPYYDEKSDDVMNANIEKNLILYGPPGTGKTYHSAIYAVAIIENRPLEEVAAGDYRKRYEQYKGEGRIEFTTFHQSYGYEEFIEGIKPVMSEDGEVSYDVVPGIFKAFCEKASSPIAKETEILGINSAPTVWKVSLEKAGNNLTRQDCMENGHIRIGYDENGESIEAQTNGHAVLNAFINEMSIGDIVLSCFNAFTIDAIGVVTGDAEWHPEYPNYKRLRTVKWLVKGISENILKINGDKRLSLPTVHRVNIALSDVFAIIQKNSVNTIETKNNQNHVFIIDEINRGNISKILGELITLIEEEKRLGGKEALKVKLPYSQKEFGVPDNIYIIGTMNTADRSIAAIDTALRRRFAFKEMLPNANIFSGIEVDGISIQKLLETMNRRIEVLYDREHTIGHAYFMPLTKSRSLDTLGEIFKNKILPLLQEYFYEDYEKIRLVLGDNQKPEETQFIQRVQTKEVELFGEDIDYIEDAYQYRINDSAFTDRAAYEKLI